VTSLVLSALLIPACGPGLPDGEVGSAEVRATAPPPPPVPPATEAPTTTLPPRPRKVLLAGDSMAGNVAPALKAALASGTVTDVRFKLTPALQGDPPLRQSWERELPLFDPDVVVMFLGVWETASAPAHGWTMEGPGRATYEAEVIDPWLRLITAYGARVVWITHAPVDNKDLVGRLPIFDAVVRALPTRWPQVEVVSATEALNGEEGPVFHNHVVGPDGVPRRTRQTDGFHLCPEGAARLAAVLADHLGGPVPEAGDWAPGPWRGDRQAFPAGKCPAIR
jgi:hypothetical protein